VNLLPKCDVCHPTVKAVWCGKCIPVPSKYKHLWPFPAFNPIQTEAFKILKENSRANIVVLSKTNTGKTQIMEMAIQRRLEKNRKGKILILEPLKALAREKVDSLKKKFPLLSILEMTSDINLGHGQERNKRLMQTDIVVCSYEMLDVMSRQPGMYSYLNYVTLLVVDEIHELGDWSRGADLDGCITRFLIYKKDMNRPIQFIGLSATFSNSETLKAYLGQFVPEVHVLTSEFSPIQVSVEGQVTAYPPYQRLPALLREIPNMLKNKGELMVMFLSKADTQKLVERLNQQYGNGFARYHHSELSLTDRAQIENDFRNRRFKVLVCTPTMLAGVNLPCQSILLDISYFNQDTFSKDVLPIQKITQAAGRVGRLPYYKTGFVKYVCDWNVYRMAQSELAKPNLSNGTILNKLDDVLNVEINMQTQMKEDLRRWFTRTFSSRAANMNEEMINALFNSTLVWLEAHKYIGIVGDQLTGTEKGDMAVKAKVRPMFLEHALDVFEKFKPEGKIFKDGDLLMLTQQLFTSPYSAVLMNNKKFDAIREQMEYVWLRTRRNSRKLDWTKQNDYGWISNMAMTLRQLSYPLIFILKDEEKRKYIRYLVRCYEKGVVPMNLIKLSMLLSKNGIQRIGNKRLIVLQMNGFSYKRLLKGKFPKRVSLPVATTDFTPLGQVTPKKVEEWDESDRVYTILPPLTIKLISKTFRRKIHD
jgi:replicative superfamily II helicase